MKKWRKKPFCFQHTKTKNMGTIHTHTCMFLKQPLSLSKHSPLSLCRFGVTLLAVLVGEGSSSRRLQLNPGSDYVLRKEDFCFYMSLTREEYTEISPQVLDHKPSHSKLAENMGRALF